MRWISSGTRLLRQGQIQWAPTLTFHDPTPPITIDHSTEQSYSYTMQGGSLNGGLADELRKKLYSMSAGSLNGGLATQVRKVKLSPVAGALTGGVALQSKGYQTSMVGGSINGGFATEVRKISLITSNGAVVGGLALQAKGYLFIMLDGALIGGEADYEWIPGFQSYEWIMEGGILGGGIADLLRKKVFIGVGGLEAGGEILYSKKISFIMLGGAIEGGKAIVLGALECITGKEIQIITISDGKLAKRISDTFYLKL